SDLDSVNPSWENDTGPAIESWIPLGVGKFGVYPKLTAPQTVTIVGLGYPVPNMAALTGSEPSPFEQGYNDMLVSYASHARRWRQAGPEFTSPMWENHRFWPQS